MEIAPISNDNVDAITDYAERCKAGNAQAQEAIDAVEGFDKLDYRGQYAVLHEMLNKFYMDGESHLLIENIASRMKTIELEEDRDKIDEELLKIREYYQQEAIDKLEEVA